jgi:membrane associated rhomboid family serine protease
LIGMGVPQRPTVQARAKGFAQSGFGMLLVAVLAAWIIEIVDQVVMDDRLQRNGIHPREVDGIDGIVWAPFLHSGFGHVASNTVPLLVMGGLIAARGRTYWARITLTTIAAGGALVWLLGGSGNHIGASGVVFGYLGALLGAAWFERRPAALGGALIAIFLYSGSLAGLVPQGDLSWESHLFGFVVGVLAARALAEPRRRPGQEDGYRYDWELDEPWRD